MIHQQKTPITSNNIFIISKKAFFNVCLKGITVK